MPVVGGVSHHFLPKVGVKKGKELDKRKLDHYRKHLSAPFTGRQGDYFYELDALLGACLKVYGNLENCP
jgi:hypothetical protein